MIGFLVVPPVYGIVRRAGLGGIQARRSGGRLEVFPDRPGYPRLVPDVPETGLVEVPLQAGVASRSFLPVFT